MRTRRIAAIVGFGLVGACAEMTTYMEPAPTPGGEPGQISRACSTGSNFIIFPDRASKSDILVAIGAGLNDRNGAASRAPVWVLLIIEKNGSDMGGLANLFQSAEARQRRSEEYRRPVEVVAANHTATLSWEGGGQREVKLDFPNENRLVVSGHVFQQRVDVEGFSGNWIEIDLPTISFEGRTVEIPRVRFEKVRKLVTTAINC